MIARDRLLFFNTVKGSSVCVQNYELNNTFECSDR